MRKYFNVILKIITIVLFIVSVSTKSLAQDTPLTIEAGVIPEKFNQNNDTLLIFSFNPFYNMSIKKHFKNNYTGNFIFVKSLEEHSVDNCRYVLYEGTLNTGKIKVGGPFNGQQTNTITHGNFTILDRQTDTQYINPNIASPKLVKAYAAALDEARKSVTQ
jgi:hypothetical protein